MKINWIALSVITSVLFAIFITLFNGLAKKGFSAPFLLFIICSIYAITFGIQTFATKQLPTSISFGVLALIIFLGILGAVANLGQAYSIITAPNSGLALAIITTYTGLVALTGVLFFKDKLNTIQIVGLVLSLVAIVIINAGSAVK